MSKMQTVLPRDIIANTLPEFSDGTSLAGDNVLAALVVKRLPSSDLNCSITAAVNSTSLTVRPDVPLGAQDTARDKAVEYLLGCVRPSARF